MNTKAHISASRGSQQSIDQSDAQANHTSRMKRRLFVGLHGLLIALTMGLVASQGYAGHLQHCTKSWKGNWSCVFNYLFAQSEPPSEAAHARADASPEPVGEPPRTRAHTASSPRVAYAFTPTPYRCEIHKSWSYFERVACEWNQDLAKV